jgi:hypothetical protein
VAAEKVGGRHPQHGLDMQAGPSLRVALRAGNLPGEAGSEHERPRDGKHGGTASHGTSIGVTGHNDPTRRE